MEKERLFTLEFGVSKDGATGYLVKELNALLVESRGNRLAEEGAQVIGQILQEISVRKLTHLIMDMRLYEIPSDDVLQEVMKSFVPMLIDLGVKRVATVLPENTVSEMIIGELMDNIHDLLENRPTKTLTTSNFSEAVDWIKQEL